MSAFQLTILLSQLLGIFSEEKQIILGKHSREERGLDLIGKFSTPGVFYEHFVKPGVPLLWKGVLDDPKVKFPAYYYWTDGYFREKFGDEEYNVEVQKKENRNKKSVKMALTQFLDEYKIKPIYMIDSLSQKMKEDLALPSTLQCGGFEKSINDVVMWLSSGGTRSVLHKDPLNNFMCILEGSKDFVLFNKKYEEEVESVGWVEEGNYSTVDVDNVNQRKFSTLLSLPWVRGHAKEGDCIFIPYGWYHQIRSNGRRNLAVNYWFTHRWWFNHPDCIKSSTFNLTEPLNKYPLASSNEILRFRMLRPYRNLEYILKDQFLEPDVDKEGREQLFEFINLDRDNVLTWLELYMFDIDEAVLKYHSVLALDYVRTVDDVRPETEEVKEEQDEGQGVEIDEGVVIEEYPDGSDTLEGDARSETEGGEGKVGGQGVEIDEGVVIEEYPHVDDTFEGDARLESEIFLEEYPKRKDNSKKGERTESKSEKDGDGAVEDRPTKGDEFDDSKDSKIKDEL